MNYIELPLASIIIIHRLNLVAKIETIHVSDSYCDKISYEILLLSIHQLIGLHPPQLRVPSRWKTSKVLGMLCLTLRISYILILSFLRT